jgi:hypothetical protein
VDRTMSYNYGAYSNRDLPVKLLFLSLRLIDISDLGRRRLCFPARIEPPFDTSVLSVCGVSGEGNNNPGKVMSLD